ncbi:MAG: OsmC family protein [Gammaproteobacteria bacterium]|nr:OsmC family peroxiredoxin [Gammaproteobacteria bacterium]
MKIERSGSATWSGGLKDGRGTVSLESGVLKDQPYGFAARFESGPGTNPEELIAAAHAGCFTMALSLVLEQAGYKATRMSTNAVVTLEKAGDGFTISAVALTLDADIPGIDEATFRRLTEDAKANCPVSKLLNAAISLQARLR